MQFKFIPHAHKENAFKSCLFFNVEDMLSFMNKPEFITHFCGLSTQIGSVNRSNLIVKECTPFTVSDKTFTHEVYVNETLIGYTNFDFMYDEFKEMEELNENSDVQKIIAFAQDNTSEAEIFRGMPDLQTFGEHKDKAFLIAGQRCSVHQWLESLLGSSNPPKADYQVILDDIQFSLDPLPTEQDFNHPAWSVDFPQIYTQFLEMLSALNSLVKYETAEA